MDNNSQARLSVRRQSRTRLDPLHIPPLDTSEPVRHVPQSLCYAKWQQVHLELKDVEDEGQDLFQNFLKDQIERESTIAADEILFRLSGYRNDLWVEDGLALRLKADDFTTTRQRKTIRNNSTKVDLNMTHDQFKDYLNQFYLQDRARLSGVLVLFFLCSDILLRALGESLELFQKYLMWSLQFIKNSVSLWIYHQGGWQVVLKTPVHPIIKVCLWIAVSAIALYTLVRLNKWKTPRV